MGGLWPWLPCCARFLGALSGPRKMAIPRRDGILVIRDPRLRPRFLWWRRRRPAWLAQLRGGDEDMVCVGLARDVPSILDSDPVDGSQREHLVPSICFRHHWRRHASVRHGHEFGHPPTFPSVFQRTAE